MVGQCQELYKAKELTILKYLYKVQVHFSKSDKGREIFTVHLLREDNNRVGLLSKLAIFNFMELSLDVWIEILKRTNVREYKIVTTLIIIHED